MIDLLIKLKEEFGHIEYEDSRHVYVDSRTGEILTSVTSLIKKYRTEFPTEFMSKKKAKERGITQGQILLEWEIARELGLTSGSIFHNYLENRWFNKTFPVNYCIYPYLKTLDKRTIDEFHYKCNMLMLMCDKFIEDHQHIIPIRTELLVGNEKFAGQMDFFGYDTITKDYVIFDYKGDKKIDFENRYQNFKKPLTHLNDCEFEKYSLQVNIYRKLLEPVVEVNDMYIIWFNINNNKYIKIKVDKNDDNINLIL